MSCNAEFRTGGSGSVTLLDCHVHCSADVKPERFLDESVANFRRATALSPTASLFGCLCLAEIGSSAQFDRFRELGRGGRGGWSITETEEACAVVARCGADTLYMIAGRQLCTSERLEVLALGTLARLADGLSLDATVRLAREGGAVAVLPWGLGKWWFRRGDVMASLLRGGGRDDIIVADTWHRPRGVPYSRILRLAAMRDFRIMRGSDSSPRPGVPIVAGTFGTVIDTILPFDAPVAGLTSWLRRAPRPLPGFGRRVSLGGFARASLRMRSRGPLRGL
jgi:hypothetical protein